MLQSVLAHKPFFTAFEGGELVRSVRVISQFNDSMMSGNELSATLNWPGSLREFQNSTLSQSEKFLDLSSGTLTCGAPTYECSGFACHFEGLRSG